MTDGQPSLLAPTAGFQDGALSDPGSGSGTPSGGPTVPRLMLASVNQPSSLRTDAGSGVPVGDDAMSLDVSTSASTVKRPELLWVRWKLLPSGFKLLFTRGMFHCMVGRRAAKISTMHVFLQAGRRVKCRSVLVKYVGLGECPAEEEFACVADADCPRLFHGILRVALGPILNECYEEFGHLRLNGDIRETALRNVYLLCDYETVNDDQDWDNGQNCFGSRDCI